MSSARKQPSTFGDLPGAQGADHGTLQEDTKGFEALSQILKTRCGIDLPPSAKNLSLMASRMRKLLIARQVRDYSAYAELIQKNVPGVMNEFISALTTNTTHFFREAEHFNHLRKVLPGLVDLKRKEGSTEIRVWCAASSTGQEPYTILMSLLEAGVIPPNWTVKFLATDIDTKVLQKASQAVYEADEVENIPQPLLSKYFETGIEGGGKVYRVQRKYASMIKFARLNLIDPNWPFQGKFDIVFCRNVLIYFDSPTAQRVVERLAGQLRPGGFLYVGHSECGHVKTKIVKGLIAAAYLRLPGEGLNGGSGK